jgi:hypothetical protein
MESMRSQLKDKKVSCRYCGGDHFTARCPYKDTLGAALGEGKSFLLSLSFLSSFARLTVFQFVSNS